ncbi:hypothetical protein BSLG_010123 [Batrachochytrium salamandrivorans]|nr:hypothetical protein BSLG_010123 [Batrachochytrium salamandrivorans]
MSAAVASGVLPAMAMSIVSNSKYKCPKKFCSKQYKNANGLKYHLRHGNCEYEATSAPIDGLHSFRIVTDSASATDVGSGVSGPSVLCLGKSASDGQLSAGDTFLHNPDKGILETNLMSPLDTSEYHVKISHRPYWCRVCFRKYKNLNGLKYHARTEHSTLDFRLEVKGHTAHMSKDLNGSRNMYLDDTVSKITETPQAIGDACINGQGHLPNYILT